MGLIISKSLGINGQTMGYNVAPYKSQDITPHKSFIFRKNPPKVYMARMYGFVSPTRIGEVGYISSTTVNVMFHR